MNMRKILVFIATSVLLAACSESSQVDITMSQPALPEASSSIRSYSEALAIAKNSISILNGKATTRSAYNDRKIDLTDTCVYKSNSKTRTGSNINDTLIYVFNFENNDGFALVSASKATNGLLAVTERGHCDPDTDSGIEGFDMFVEKAKNYVAAANIPAPEPIDTMESIIEDTIYIYQTFTGPYLNVKWGQSYAEGEYCPNHISGCAATAMGQVMTYYEYPDSMPITFPNSDVTLQVFDWTAIKGHSTKHYISICFPENYEVHRSIGRLCRQLGYLANSTYSSYSTSTYTNRLQSAMENIGYQITGWNNYSSSNTKNMLDNGKIMIMYGNVNGNNGHFWVLDGYYKDEYIIDLYLYIHGRDELIPDGSIGPFTTRLNHINWGWYGVNNGYFDDGVFNTYSVQLPDTPDNYASYNFNNCLWTLAVDIAN